MRLIKQHSDNLKEILDRLEDLDRRMSAYHSSRFIIGMRDEFMFDLNGFRRRGATVQQYYRLYRTYATAFRRLSNGL